MSDDLVKRLRFGIALDEQGDVSWCNQEAMFKAADHIEKLEAALREIAEDCEIETGLVQGTQVCAMIARNALEGKDD